MLVLTERMALEAYTNGNVPSVSYHGNIKIKLDFKWRPKTFANIGELCNNSFSLKKFRGVYDEKTCCISIQTGR